MTVPPTVLVTGAGRGIGRSTARAFLHAGWRVVAGVRDTDRARTDLGAHERALVVRLDVTRADEVTEGVAAAQGFAGGALACVVSNAGYALLGAQEDADLHEARRMFETNVFGAAAVLQAALPAMREAGRGSVVIVSSIGAHLSVPLLGFYNASKHALNAMSEALALEMRPFGVRVNVIEPGVVDSDFPKATRLSGALAKDEGPYLVLRRGVRSGIAAWREQFPLSPDEVAAAVLAAAIDPRTPFRVLVGDDARRLEAARAASGSTDAWLQRLAEFLELDDW